MAGPYPPLPNLKLVAAAALIGWHARKSLFDVLTAASPGYFSAVVTGYRCAHGLLLD